MKNNNNSNEKQKLQYIKKDDYLIMAENKKELREGLNKIEITGVVADFEIKESEYEFTNKETNKKETVEKIGGWIDVRVKDDEKKIDDVHRIGVNSNKYTKDGKENSIYKGLQTLKDELVSEAEDKENATKVRIDNGKFGVYDRSVGGQITTYPQVSANFVHRLTKATDLENYKPQAKFNLEVYIQGVKEETDKEGETTGRQIVNGFVVDFKENVLPIEFVSGNQKAADFIENNFEKNTTVQIGGDIRSQSKKVVKKIEMDFGDDQEQVTWENIREWQITSGKKPVEYEEGEENGAYSPKAVKKALAARDEYLEGLKTKEKEKGNEGGSGNSKRENQFTKGKGKTVDIDSNDLPF